MLIVMTLQTYLDEYKESHQNPVNIKIHFVCVPLIMWSLLGFLHTWTLGGSVISLSHVAAVLGILYYFSFRNKRVVGAMALVTVLMLISFYFVPELRWVSIFVFVLTWLGQFYGHKVEGKKPSFLKDLSFLLIGPVWILKKIAPRFL